MKEFAVKAALLLAVIVGVGLCAPAPRAQAPANASPAVTAPAPLTEVQKLQIVNAAQTVTILELQLQAARQALQQLVVASTPAGFTLNEKLDLVPMPASPKKP